MHLWVRAESRANEMRVGLMPKGAADLVAAGFDVSVEEAPHRTIAAADYLAAGCKIVPQGSWTTAPRDAVIFGIKELPDDGTPLVHRHILFGHAFKGQPDGQRLLSRFRAGGGALYDLESLTNEAGRRLAAFGYWAGYAGAAVALLAFAAQARGAPCPQLGVFADRMALLAATRAVLTSKPSVIVIGAQGRTGSGACDLCDALGLPVTRWDIAETAHGGPFPEILAHEIFLNCILAGPGCPVFVAENAGAAPRFLRVIGDIACDPGSDFSPIKVYDRPTTWAAPAMRVHTTPPLDVTAIDNLPSLLPREASEDFAAQLLPVLRMLDHIDLGPWGRSRVLFEQKSAGL